MDCTVSPWGRKELDMTECLSLTGDTVVTYRRGPCLQEVCSVGEDTGCYQSDAIPFVKI